jgi:hypothetical protein
MSTSRNAQAGPSTYVARRIEDVGQEEKGEEELDLEEVLFGRKRRRAVGSAVEEKQTEDEEEPAFFYDGMGDEDVELGNEESEDGSEKQVRRSASRLVVSYTFAALLHGQLGPESRSRRRIII